MPTIQVGQLVDVRARGSINTYRVINATLPPTKFHSGSYHFMIARRFDPTRGVYLPARMVQVMRVVRVHREVPASHRKRPRRSKGAN